MAEILPSGKIQEYTGICPECKQETSVNMQGTPINHECEVKNLDIPHVSDAVCHYRPCLDQYNGKCLNGTIWKTCNNRQTAR